MLLSILIALPLARAAQDESPKAAALPAQDWQLKGIRAALEDPDPVTRVLGLAKLGELAAAGALAAEPASDSVKDLEGIIRLVAQGVAADHRSWVRSSAAEALGRLGEHATGALPAFTKLLVDPDTAVRRSAAEALGRLGEHAAGTVLELTKLLVDPDAVVRQSAAEALGRLGEHAAGAVPELTDLFADRFPRVRRSAAEALGRLGEHAATAVPKLTELLADPDTDVQDGAADALAELGESAAAAVPELTKLLTGEQIRVRPSAARALGQLGGHAVAVAELTKMLADQDTTVRRSAGRALGRLGGRAAVAVPELRKLLYLDYRGWNTGVVDSATEALGRLGEHAAPAVPELTKLLIDPFVGRSAANALGMLGEHAAAAVPELRRLLTIEDPQVREVAADVLGRLGEHAAVAVPELMKLLADENLRVQFSATRALARLGEHAAAAVPELTKLLADEDHRVRQNAAEVLGALGAHAAQAVPELRRLLADENSWVLQSAAEALGRLGEHAAVAVPELTKLLSSNDYSVRQSAAEALGQLGAPSSNALPLLASLLSDTENGFRQTVTRALEEIAVAVSHPQAVPSERNELSGSGSQVVGHVERLLLRETIAQILANDGLLTGAREVDRLRAELRFWAHYLGGGELDTEDLIEWLVREPRSDAPFRSEPAAFRNHYPQPFDLIDLLIEARGLDTKSSSLPRTVSARIAKVARLADEAGMWQVPDIDKLERIAGGLELSDHDAVLHVVRNIRSRAKVREWSVRIVAVLSVHALFWASLIWLYPRFKVVQAIFFWNRWVRRIGGLVYVGLLVTWIPFLRRRLLSPFGEALVSPAAKVSFEMEADFRDRKVRQGKRQLSIDDFEQVVRGHRRVLVGDSGLGKSWFIARSIQKRRPATVAHLFARDCGSGVVERLADLLLGQAKDSAFLQSIIHSGRLEVFIDGLNEAGPEARNEVCRFLRAHSQADVLVTTQQAALLKLEIEPAVVWELEPIAMEGRKAFLLTRHPEDGGARAMEYRARVERFLTRASEARRVLGDEEEVGAQDRILSNPMDLTFVAALLHEGIEPDVYRLQEQLVDKAASEFEAIHGGQPFPLDALAELVYRMRSEGQVTTADCPQAFEVLERHKLAILVVEVVDGFEHKEWKLRHEKIADHFLAQAFLRQRERIERHAGDEEFRGVYVHLAQTLSCPEAEELKQFLADRATRSGDHSLSDLVWRIVSSRCPGTDTRARPPGDVLIPRISTRPETGRLEQREPSGPDPRLRLEGER